MPSGRHVQRLVEGAFVGGAVAETADGDGIVPHDLGGQGAASGDGLTGTDDAVGTQVVHLLHICNVHGTALALAVAGDLAEQLCHSQLGVRTAGDGVTMAPVGGGEVIFGFDGRESARFGCLLADTQVNVACQHSFGKTVGCVLFKGTDANHIPVQRQQEFLVIGCHNSQHDLSSMVLSGSGNSRGRRGSGTAGAG